MGGLGVRAQGAGAGGLAGTLALLVLLVGAGLGLGGEPSQFALAGVQYLPFILLAGLVQASGRSPVLRTLAWIGFWLVLLGVAGVTVGLVLAALIAPGGGDLRPEDVGRVLAALGLSALGLVLGVALVASGGWFVVGRWLGGAVEQRRVAHAQGLVGLLVFTALACVPLVVLQGEAPLLRLVAQGPLADLDRGATGQVLDVWYGLLWTLPLALVGAGVPLLRGWRAGLARLGLLSLRRRDLLLLAAIAIGLVAFAFAVDAILAAVFDRAGWRRTDADLVERLFGAAISPVGAVTVGVSAGLGEEVMARGLLQPRFGWLLPNLAFAAAHAFQYGPDGVISVFLTGAVLAGVRARWNTTAAALTHGLYDFILIVGAVLALPGF